MQILANQYNALLQLISKQDLHMTLQADTGTRTTSVASISRLKDICISVVVIIQSKPFTKMEVEVTGLMAVMTAAFQIARLGIFTMYSV